MNAMATQRMFEPDQPASGDLAGTRVLVVEDEFLLGLSLEEDLRHFGCFVLGPFGSLASAFKAARGADFDLAVLDVNLNGELVYPLADSLLERGIPVLFLSGYEQSNLPPRFRTAPRLAKPYDPKQLLEQVRRLRRWSAGLK